MCPALDAQDDEQRSERPSTDGSSGLERLAQSIDSLAQAIQMLAHVKAMELESHSGDEEDEGFSVPPTL